MASDRNLVSYVVPADDLARALSLFGSWGGHLRDVTMDTDTGLVYLLVQDPTAEEVPVGAQPPVVGGVPVAPPTPPEANSNSVTMAARVLRATAEAYQTIADARGVPKSDLIREALMDWLSKNMINPEPGNRCEKNQATP